MMFSVIFERLDFFAINGSLSDLAQHIEKPPYDGEADHARFLVVDKISDSKCGKKNLRSEKYGLILRWYGRSHSGELSCVCHSA